MSKSIHNQLDHTREFLEAAGIPEKKLTEYWRDFWWDHTNPSHLRLSSQGIQFIKKHTKIPIFTVDLSTPLVSKHLIYLSRVCFCPYYIHAGKRIVLLGQDEATMITLHAGNLGQYLENLQL